MLLFDFVCLQQEIPQKCVICNETIYSLRHVCNIRVYHNLIHCCSSIQTDDRISLLTNYKNNYINKLNTTLICYDKCNLFHEYLPEELKLSWIKSLKLDLNLFIHEDELNEYGNTFLNDEKKYEDGSDEDSDSSDNTTSLNSYSYMINLKLNLQKIINSKRNMNYFKFHELVFKSNLLKTINNIMWNGPECLLDFDIDIFYTFLYGYKQI